MTPVSGGAAVVGALKRHEVELIWGIPGTHNLEVYAHLGAAGIRHILPRHEQGAAFAADGYARATGRPGVCLTTSGPAVLNAATALAQSWSDSVPVLLISAGMPLDHPGRGNGHLHEAKDLHGAMQSLVAYSHRVTSIGEISTAIAQAFATMTGGRPRPVHVEVPVDLLERHDDATEVDPIRTATVTPAPESLDVAARVLLAAERPMVIGGGGTLDASSELVRICHRLQSPVVTTFNGKGTINIDDPMAMGTGLHRDVVRELAEASDVVLVVGSELAPADLWNGPLELDRRVVRIDIDSDQAAANAIPAVAVTGDAALSLRGLSQRLGGAAACATRAARVTDWRARFEREAAATTGRWAWLLDPIAQVLGDSGVLVGDSATVCYYGAGPRLPARRPRGFLYPTGFGTLGYGLPAGIGAKLGRPDDPVVVLIGDGGIMFTLSELATAASLGLALPIVVVDNGGYEEIRNEMAARGDEPLAVSFTSPNFAKLAKSLGCNGTTARDSDDLATALAHALTADRPTVIHVRDLAFVS